MIHASQGNTFDQWSVKAQTWDSLDPGILDLNGWNRGSYFTAPIFDVFSDKRMQWLCQILPMIYY